MHLMRKKNGYLKANAQRNEDLAKCLLKVNCGMT